MLAPSDGIGGGIGGGAGERIGQEGSGVELDQIR